jgi:pilus assembly protein FimV
LNLDDLAPPAASVVAPVVATALERRAAPRDFSGSMSAPLRSINTQEVLDIRQQAEFFMTLGQYDDAISLLEAHIAENPRSNPLVYLDLLKALHTLSRKVTFDHYRNAFNSVFTGQIPVYTQFNQVGAGLEAYPELCDQIASMWPSPAVVDFIETYLVRDPEGATDLRLDLEAFRELLLLHAIAGRLGAEHPSGVMPFSAAKNVDMLTATEPADTGTGPVDAVLPPMAHALAQGSVDLDLSDLAETPKPADDNLIDFDASGLSLTPREDDPRT